MADLSSLLTVIEHDPDDAQAFEALAQVAASAPADARASRFSAARKVLAGRGRPDAVVALLDAELAATFDTERKVDLLLEKGMLLDGELLDVPGAQAAFEAVLEMRPDDSMAKEALGEIELAAGNWKKFAEKYISEATASTDRSLATGLYVSAAEAYVRFAPDAPEAEGYLRRALEIDPRSSKAAFHLQRLLRRAGRWDDLATLLEQRSDVSPATDEKVAALLALTRVTRDKLKVPERADAAMRRILQLDPAQPQALRTTTDALASVGDWPNVVRAYQAALKSRREEDIGILLQIAMVLWKHVGDLDQAEEYFRRVRKIEPAHLAALDFYRVYYPAKGEHQKLLALLRQVEKSPRARTDEGSRGIGLEIAELAEAQNNPEKAIEAWKQQLRADPNGATATQARQALARLYRKTEKWNALLDLMKEEAERIPESDIAGRVGKWHEIVEIYRDKLKLDVMVINTYNTILKLDPDNRRATDELAAKFRALGRWNDLIAVLTRKSEVGDVPDHERIKLLREIAELWAERFGNYANAIRPLERILEISPADPDAVARLKEIYTKRRQWRPLIDVLGREADALPEDERRAKQGEMARLAADKLGDTRLAIEIYNGILVDAGPTHHDTLLALTQLYDREKRWPALAEVLHRQVNGAKHKDAIAIYERLGQIYADRLQAPAQAAQAWQHILDIEPGHAKALRTLRELYATAGDFNGLEKLYAKLGQEEELVEALLGIADRLDSKAQRLPLVERAAQLAQQRAEAAVEQTEAPGQGIDKKRRGRADRGETPAQQALDRARQVWERVLAVDTNHLGAASALTPIYTKQEKWAKLITVLEIELAAAGDTAKRLEKIAEIRRICEQKLASRTLAFTWTLRAFDLDPQSEPLYGDVLRLASEAEHWREVATTFERHAKDEDLPQALRLKLYRELARLASKRLNDPERARAYHRQVLALAADDREAEQHLEELAIQLADWPELLASYRNRAAREKDPTERASLLIEIASLQEEKLVDLDGAAATYHEALAALPGQNRALRALARIEEARGDWESLAKVLDAQLAQTPDGQPRFDLLMRLGALNEQQLDRPSEALGYFKSALGVPAVGGGVRPQAIGAIARYLAAQGPGAKLEPAERIAAARLVLPHLEGSGYQVQQAVALETIRAGADTSASEKLDIDRRLMRLHHIDLADQGAAWTAGLRVLAADPADADNRAALAALAGQLGRDGEWAQQLAGALVQLKTSGPPSEIRAVATELAHVAGGRLNDRVTAERAWRTVLDVEPDAHDAFEALTEQYRTDQRWQDLRGLLERRTEVAMDDRVRRAVLLELASLEEDVLADPERAIAAHRRILDVDPGAAGSYQALDRLYTAGQQWQQLEELLARQVDHVRSPHELTDIAYRRAELFAHKLGDPVRAVDLLEDVLGRQRGHADARELLEELLPKPDVALRVARLLEPQYEQDKLWKDLVVVLRAQRKLATGHEAVELLCRIAAIEEAELGGAGLAFDAWTEVIALDPSHERARSELVRLAQQLNRWPEATNALESAVTATPVGDTVTRSALLAELASYYDYQLGDANRAIGAYKRLFETDASNPQAISRACAALARLYEEQQAWTDLRAVMRKQAEWAQEADEKRALLARVAALEEEHLKDADAAIATWRDILIDQPADASALNALERLYQNGERWRDLIDVLRRKLDHADPYDGKQLLGRIADIHEHKLRDTDEAIAAYLEIVDGDPDDRRALGELARLYRQSNRHADLLDVLEKQAQLDPVAWLGFQVEIAQLLAGPLGRSVEALERWQAILQAPMQEPEPTARALAAVEAALSDPDLRGMAADILRPVYERMGEYEELALLSHRAADWAEDPQSKLRALAEVVRLREHRLGDKAGAFGALLQALQFSAAEPELPRVIAETERLAGELEREGDLIDAYREVAPNVLDAEIQRRLYLDIADLARAVRRDMSLARDYYQKVLDAQPDDARALAALESIYRETNDHDRLTEVLLRQADVASSDVEDRVAALVEAAGFYVELRRPDDAIATWEQVLAVAPERRDAVEALEALYREQGRWPDVVDLYERRLGFATSIEEAVELRVALGEIHEKQLRDLETAIDNYSAALSGDSRNERALTAVERYLVDPDLRVVAAEVLEPIYVAQQRWSDLIRVYDARLESAVDPRDRLRLTRFVARLYEEQLEDFENAARWYAKVFREAPNDPAIRDQLQRLASVVDNWGFVAQTYQQYLDDESGDTNDLRDIAIAAATIYDRRLNDVDRAFAAYRRALAIPVDDAVPNERELVRRLEELLGRAQKWPELIEVYDEVIARADDDLRREALIKRSRLLEDGMGDAPRAIEAWREVVLVTEGGGSPVIEHGYREAVAELERLYRNNKQWRDLVELYESRLARTQQALEVADLRLKLADLLETEVGDLPGALDQYEHVIQDGPHWERAVAALERLVIHDEYRERITDLLEPVYRREDWWQKLVVILDAKLDYIQSPSDQIAALHEIAGIHEERGGALDLALEALARAWRIDVAEDESLSKLLSLAGKLEAWDEAVTTLEAGAPTAPNADMTAGLWARAAQIHELYRQDLERATAAWRKVEEARPDDALALAALDRMLALQGKVDQLVVVVARRAEQTEDPGVRLVLLHRVAALYEEVLGEKQAAIVAYRNVLGLDDTDLAALDALERLYQETGDGRELAGVLERKIELTSDVAARQELRLAAAKVYEQQLDDVYQAIGQLSAMLDDNPNDATALAELDRIYEKQKMWPDLLEVIDRRAVAAANASERADLAFRAAHLVETELNDPDGAIPRYGAVLQIAPANMRARAALESLMAKDTYVDATSPLLERVYRGERDPGGLVRVYERRIAAGGGDKRADWTALADVYETLAGAPERAFAVWSRAIAATPDDSELLQPLMRLAESQRLWSDLAARLEQLLEEPLPPETEQAYAMRLGQISEEKLGALAGAAAAFERAANGPEPKPALQALERVLARSERWADLAAVLRREADIADNDGQIADFRYREGDLQETTLHDNAAAIAAYREVLAIAPGHPQARMALERMLAKAPEQRKEIVEILEPLFDQDGDAGRLVLVLEARLAVTDDPLDKSSLLGRIVELAEQRLGDKARALDGALRWLAVDPASSQALAEVDRLGERLGQWQEVAQRVQAITRSRDAVDREPDVQVALLTFLGRVQRKHLGQLDEAAVSYRAALTLEPEALPALDDLVKILRQRGDQNELAETLLQRGRVVAELPEKRAAYSEVALIRERAGDRAGAIAAWREYSDADDSDRGALDELAHLYRAQGDKAALVDTLQRAARLATSPDDEKKLRTEIAQLEGDSQRAVAAWQAVLDLDPDDLKTLDSLEMAYAKAGDWIAVGDLQGRRLALAETPAEKIAIHASMARIAEERRGAIDDAVASWYAALDVDPTSKQAFGELERLLGAAERWHDLVDLLERRAELEATLDDTKAEIAALARAADVWESKLDNPDAAGEILEKILARDPGSVAALTRLSKIYERAGDWDKCKGVLEQALRLSPTGHDAAELFHRLGEVARVGDSDNDTAVQHLQHALRHDPNHGPSIAALEKLARDRRDVGLLADMLHRRVQQAPTPSDRVQLLVEIADLERRAGKTDAALTSLAQARSDAPDDARILAPLADLFFAAGRLDEAAPIYDRLATEAKAGRRMKDVARFRQRQGGILEARGDQPGALAAYEEALRVNPTDVVTMTGLGRLYFASGDWEKARKIYQSLVLQNIDSEAGVTKGEVYWALGTIHLQLGQPPKAKSMFQRGLEIEPNNQRLKEALSSLR